MKEPIAIVALLCALALNASARTYYYDPYAPEPLPSGAPLWMHAIDHHPSELNYYTMDSLFNLWCGTDVDVRVKTRNNKQVVNYFRRWQKAYRGFVDAKGNIVLPTEAEYYAKLDAQNAATQQRAAKLRKQGAAQPLWRNIGPNSTYNQNAQPKDYQACIFRITVAPSDHNTVYCGAETGVVFKTTNKGASWEACNGSHNFGGSIYSIAVHPTNPDIVLVGGGTSLWTSTNGGATWQRHPQIYTRVHSIRFNPSNPKEVTIATAATKNSGRVGGFHLSTDGGENFTLILEGDCYDHELQPSNPNHIYLLLRPINGYATFFYKSTDGGRHFTAKTMSNNFDINAGRLAVSEATGGSNYVYALVTSNVNTNSNEGSGKPYIMQSTDGGESWTDKTTRVSQNATDSRNSFYDLDERGGQGFFDMTLGASNSNPDHVIFGLCCAYRSTQGGSGGWGLWGANTGIGGYVALEKMHPDIQDIAIAGNDTWIATDGGVKYSGDFFATTGQDRMKGIYASDYHGFDMGWNEDVVVGGRWHNGNAVQMATYGEGRTMHLGGVERATGHVMVSDPKRVYFTDDAHYVLSPDLNTPPTYTYDVYFTQYKPYETLRANGLIAPDPRYAQRLLMNGREASDEWQTRDLYQMYMSEDDGKNFQSVYDSDYVKLYNYEFARSNPNYIYVAETWDMAVSTDGGNEWDWVNFPFNSPTPNMLAVDPNDEHTVWISNTSEKGAVYRSTNGGTTWECPLSGELLNQAFYWIVLTGDEYNGVYLGTTDGAKVYYKDNTMTEWMDYSDGLNPGMRITRLMPFYKDGKLRIGSNQGIWEAPLYRQDFRPTAQPIALNLGNGNLVNDPNKRVQLDSYSIVKQEDGTRWEWTITPEPKYISSKNIRNPVVEFGYPAHYDITLKITTPSNKTHSRTIRNMVWTTNEPPTTNLTPTLTTPTITLTPQPATCGEPISILIDGMEGEKILTLHNSTGRLLHKTVLAAHQTQAQIATDHLTPGVYIYEVKTLTQKSFGKIIVQ